MQWPATGTSRQSSNGAFRIALDVALLDARSRSSIHTPMYGTELDADLIQLRHVVHVHRHTLIVIRVPIRSVASKAYVNDVHRFSTERYVQRVTGLTEFERRFCDVHREH